jgi:hypothetical protein
MMTGRSPLEHRILDFTRWNPATGAREPITSDERAVPAIWNMVAASGQSAAVLGLWATYPAERIGGLMVSDRAIQLGSRGPGAVSPAERAGEVDAARAAAESSVDLASLRALLPDLTSEELATAAARPAGEAYGEPVSALRRIVIETRTVQALARAAAASHPRLLVAYFEGTDTIGHVFAPFAAPRQEAVSESDFARYRQVAERYFEEIDRDLGELRDLARAEGAVLMIASDHGFRWGEDRPRELSSLAAASAARWHRDQGVSLLWGPEIAPTPRSVAGEGSVRQVCATLLALLGMPRRAASQDRCSAARRWSLRRRATTRLDSNAPCRRHPADRVTRRSDWRACGRSATSAAPRHRAGCPARRARPHRSTTRACCCASREASSRRQPPSSRRWRSSRATPRRRST